MKLIDFIKVDVRDSNLAVPCEVTPGHMSKTYVLVSFEKAAIAAGKPVMNRTELRVCPQCFAMFCYDIQVLGRQLSVA